MLFLNREVSLRHPAAFRFFI